MLRFMLLCWQGSRFRPALLCVGRDWSLVLCPSLMHNKNCIVEYLNLSLPYK